MKKRIILLFSVLIASAMTIFAENITLKDYTWEVSETVGKNNAGTLNVCFNCALPENANTALSKAILVWACKTMGDESALNYNNIAAYINMLGKNYQTDFKPQLIEMCQEFEDTECQFDISILIKKTFENAQYVTMHFDKWENCGGAHGNAETAYVTFRKSDGYAMGWDLMGNTPKAQIRQLIKKGLCKYFGVRTMAELKEYVDVDNFNSGFPLPANPPYLTAEGVSVIYQPYEIAPYAAGMPGCVIKRNAK